MFMKKSTTTEKQTNTLQDFQRQLEERSRPIDTLNLQLESLYNFASQLGYTIRGSYYDNQGFVNYNLKRAGRSHVSFDTMKHWHNDPFGDYPFTGKNLNIAAASTGRIVEKVKLQRTKNGIIAQDHYVKLVTDSREDYLKYKFAEACPTLTNEQLEQLAGSGLL